MLKLGAALLGTLGSACSFVLVRAPTEAVVDSSAASAASATLDCTSSKAVPVVDAVASGAYAIRALYVAGTGDSFYPNRPEPMIRTVDVAMSAALSALFLASAYYGDRTSEMCADAQTRALRASVR